MIPYLKKRGEKDMNLKDLLDPATLAQLNKTEKQLRQKEHEKKEEEQRKRIEEQKRREKNKSFAELFNESKLDWREYK